MPVRHRFRWVILAAAAVTLAAPRADARAKTDLVFLTNGDRITGEIKQLDRGILQLSTNDIGTIRIEWEDVDSLVSIYRFRVEDRDGPKYFGTIALTADGLLEVNDESSRSGVPQQSVIGITPLEASFWQQLDGSISLGLSYTKSNSLLQVTTDINVRRRTETRSVELDISSIATSQEDEETLRREDLSLTYLRLFDGPWFVGAGASAQSNDELGLDLRVQFSPGVGLNLVQSNHNDLMSSVGLSVNREWSEGSDGTTERVYNLEAFLTVEHGVFRYDYPKTDITSDITFYPSLSNSGRVRAEIDISASREIVSDFTVVLSFYDSWDNDPPDETAAKNDYGLVASVGWTF